VESLARVELVQHLGQIRVRYGVRPDHPAYLCGDVIGDLVLLIVVDGKGQDLPKEGRIHARHRAQRLEIRGAGRLQVHKVPRHPRGNGVDRELVRPGVQAQFVRAERLGDGHVLGK